MDQHSFSISDGKRPVGRNARWITLCLVLLAFVAVLFSSPAHTQKLSDKWAPLSPAEFETYRSLFAAYGTGGMPPFSYSPDIARFPAPELAAAEPGVDRVLIRFVLSRSVSVFELEAYHSVFAADGIDARDDKPPTLLVAQNEAGMASSQTQDADLQDAFVRALKSVDELRKKDRSTVLECTYLFAEFHRYQQTEPYVLFFKSVDISVLLDDRNQRHYVAFSINHQRLWSMGYKNFLRGDRLGIVFTTSSAVSTEVTSFRVTLLNSDHL